MKGRAGDLAAAALLAALAAGLSWRGAQLVTSALDLTGGAGGHTWFGAEPADFVWRLTGDSVGHDRLAQQPLVLLVMRTPVSAILNVWPSANAAGIVGVGLAAVAALWSSGVFATLRLLGCRRADAALFTLLGLVSSAATFWAGVPDLAAVGSLTVIPIVALVAAARYGAGEWWAVAAVAASLSFRSTLGTVGLTGALFLHGWRRATQVTLNAIGVVLILWGLQQSIFPARGTIFGNPALSSDVIAAEAPPAPVSAVLFLGVNAMVMPEVRVLETPTPALTIGHAWPGSGGLAAGVALLAWIALLAIGIGGRVGPGAAKVRAFLLVGVAVQLTVCLLQGGEAFRSGLDVLPLLIALASLGVFTALRPVVLGLAVVLLVAATVTNRSQFTRSLELARPIAQSAIHEQP